MRSTAGWATATGCCSATLKPSSWPPAHPRRSRRSHGGTAQQQHGRCVVKRGADGADCWTTDSHHHAPTRPVTVIDTIGAGDSFNAGFLAALLKSGKPVPEALRWKYRRRAGGGTSPRRYPDLARPATSPWEATRWPVLGNRCHGIAANRRLLTRWTSPSPTARLLPCWWALPAVASRAPAAPAGPVSETLFGGTILMNQRPVNDHGSADRDVAMVFQSYTQFYLTVAEISPFRPCR